MPLASLFALQWYGPGLGAAVDAVVVTASADLKGLGRMASTNTTAPTASARINDGRQLRAVHTTAPTAYARPSGKGRIAAVGKVNELSQDDVTGAVLEAKVEGNLTLKQALRLLLAVASGDATDLDTNPAFKSADGSKTRVAGTRSGGTRSITTRDGT
jgi:hypothetical protein